MPTPYMMPSVPNRYPIDRNDKIGLAIGALLSGGLAAASSGNTGENPILRAIAGGVTGLGEGGKHLNDSYSAMLDDYLKNDAMDFRNKQFGQQVREYEETDKPYKEAMTRYNESLINKAETPKLPNEAQNWQFGMDIKDPRQRSEFLDRTMPLKTFAARKVEDYPAKISKIDTAIANLLAKNKDPDPPEATRQAVNSMRNTRAQYHNKQYGGGTSVKDLDFNFGTKSTPMRTKTPSIQEQGDMNEENLEYTANKYGISREDVLRRLGTK